MNKNLIIILILVATLLALSLSLYIIFGGDKPGPATEPAAGSGSLAEGFPLTETETISPNSPPAGLGENNERPTGLADPLIHETQTRAAAGWWFDEYNNEPALYYLERGSGLVYRDVLTDNAAPVSLAQIAVTGNAETHWWRSEAGLGVIIWSDEATALLINEGGEDGSLPSFQTIGVGLTGEEIALSLDPVGSRAATLNPTPAGAEVYLHNLASGQRELLHTSPLTGWNIDWAAPQTIILNTKPSRQKAGVVYALDPASGRASKLAGPASGLSTKISGTGDFLISSSQNGLGGELAVQQIGGQSTIVSLDTWAEKCAWSPLGTDVYCAVPKTLPAGNYPDDWYKGRVTTTDSLWRINTLTGEGTLIWTSSDISFDFSELALSPDEHYLGFIDRRSGQLHWLPLETEPLPTVPPDA